MAKNVKQRTLNSKSTTSLKGAIFDLDGVIVNTVPLHFEAWRKMFTTYGKQFTFHDYKAKVDGIPRIDGARAILTNLSNEDLDEAASKKQSYFLKLMEKKGIEVYKSTINLIKQLRKNKIKVAVISSSKNCLYILKKANAVNLFDVIITGNDIPKGRGKPRPDVFLLAAKRLSLKAKGCIVFEDALLGIEAAKRAKMKNVGIDRYNKPERLKKADLVVGDLSEVNISKLERLVSL
ncbi:MAG: beta-phosphoglucomutase family hydrolase [Candidatus Omnitrophica bacterium]|nr:beta-phosphoglucomutase family hydrolase [Candidatus Omnitrophota bacterium]